MPSVRTVALAVLIASACTIPPEPPQQALRAATSVAARSMPGPQPEAPPKITSPMRGEPSAAALGETRLVATSCVDDPAAVDALVKKMRAEVDEQLQVWHDEQPACWHEYRMRAEPGLGLSGIGDGGGGYGYGSIGLGSIGTIGHGSGTYSAQGYGSPRQAQLASGTNVQVAGVDEADIVKTDGRWVYLAANGALRILEAMDPKVVSVTRLPGSVRDLFVEGDRAVVYSSSKAAKKPCTYGYDCTFAGDDSATTITVLDLESRAAPRVVRTIELSGSLITSRRIGTAVHTVVADGDAEEPAYTTWPDDLQTCGTREEVVRAKFADLKRQNEKSIRASTRTLPTMKENGMARALCDGVLRTASGDGKSFTTVVSFDLADDARQAHAAMIQSRPGAVFASAAALYLAVGRRKHHGRNPWYSFYPNVDEVSEVHKLRIGRDPEATRYVGSGIVPGHVLNQFAMDEWFGYLRIATTSGKVPDPEVKSSVSVLAEGDDRNLVRVGAITDIAPGEDIRAVRFDDDRGYVVTFKKTDPLFVIDLHDPADPQILGELKIPGFSTYIHRIDRDHLLSIGFDADDKGSFAFYDGVILQLFDVTEPTAPKLLHKEKIGSRGSTSEAATNHLAFNYFAEIGKLAFPMTLCEGGGDGRDGTLSFSGLYVYDVSVEHGFEKLGGVDHGRQGVDCNTWWSHATSEVKRSLFLDDLVYSIATDLVKVQRLGHLGEDVASIALSP
jgi:beta propeller domain-containing protein